MLVIGLTGGIGTGKSEVSRILRRLGARVIDADRLGHETYRPRSEAWQEVVKAFGDEILQPSGDIDRGRLGAVVFADPESRAKLNSTMHPRMAETIRDEIDRLRTQGVEVVVLEAAVLLEAGWDSMVDDIWVVDSPEEAVLQRLRLRNSLTDEDILARIRAQASSIEGDALASRTRVVVSNSGDLEDLRERVESLWNSRVKGQVA